MVARASLCLLIMSSTLGCSVLSGKPAVEYQTVLADRTRDTGKARELGEKAVKAIEAGKPEKAEDLLQRALIADVTFAPAHNNLGKLYFDRRKFYLAAWEFQYTHELVPDAAEPLNNLGLVYESIGQFDRARDYYEQAYAIDGADVSALGNLARVIYRVNDRDDQLPAYLHEVMLRDARPSWSTWASDLLARHFNYGEFATTALRDDGFIEPHDPDLRDGRDLDTGDPIEPLPPPKTPPLPST